MDRRWTAVLAAAALLGAAPPLEAARAAMERGALEEALEALASAPAGAATGATHGELASRALAAGDLALASLACERGLKAFAKDPASLRACAQAALKDGRPDDAAPFADRLWALSPDGPTALLRGEVALARGDFESARQALGPALADKATAPRAKVLREAAERDQLEKARERSLQERLDRAVAQARALKSAEPAEAKRDSEVVLYTTSWCGVCKRAKAWLRKKGISFAERDVEKDSAAASELAERCARQGIRAGGVPVLWAGGRLLVGFDERSYEQVF